MASPLDTPDWQLNAHMGWKFVGKDKFTDCEHCSGQGTVGGGFKSLDGPQTCYYCSGTGGRMDPRPAMPPIPPELVEHMRKAWQSYFAEVAK